MCLIEKVAFFHLVMCFLLVGFADDFSAAEDEVFVVGAAVCIKRVVPLRKEEACRADELFQVLLLQRNVSCQQKRGRRGEQICLDLVSRYSVDKVHAFELLKEIFIALLSNEIYIFAESKKQELIERRRSEGSS